MKITNCIQTLLNLGFGVSGRSAYFWYCGDGYKGTWEDYVKEMPETKNLNMSNGFIRIDLTDDNEAIYVIRSDRTEIVEDGERDIQVNMDRITWAEIQPYVNDETIKDWSVNCY